MNTIPRKYKITFSDNSEMVTVAYDSQDALVQGCINKDVNDENGLKPIKIEADTTDIKDMISDISDMLFAKGKPNG